MQQGLLDIATFQDITGLELTEDDQIRMFNRANSRASRLLTKYLGWDPNYRETYSEVGISSNPGTCPTEEQLRLWQSNPAEYHYFDPAEPTVGQVKLFPYYPEDANYFIDPAIAVHSVKIVKIVSGSSWEFMTVRKLSPDDFNQKTNINFLMDHSPIIRYVEICKAPTDLPCTCDQQNPCYMLAVDADWVRTLPEDLLYLLADLIILYMQNQPSLDRENTYAIKSESVDGHSVSYDTSTVDVNSRNTEDEVLEPYRTMIQSYIGPYSTLYLNKVRVL